MKSPRHCGYCGRGLPADAPEGLCPNCLLDLGATELGLGAEGQSPGNEVRSAKPQVRQHKPQELEDTARASVASRPGSEVNGQKAAGRVPRFGNYELLEKIGEGGMGVVYKARQINLDRLVAVKLLPFGQFSRTEIVQRFRAEAAAAASLQHPNIVAIHEVGEHEGQHYFSMDLVTGHTLAELVRDQPLPAKRAAAYLKTIAEAVDYAHQHAILHRDLKPSNVLVDQADQPRITDFGLAKRLTSTSDFGPRTSDLTLTGQVLGSPNFISPEQAEGRAQTIGPASDIYSLGALLYHLLTRQPPFQAETLTALLKQVLETEPVPPRLLNPSIPRDLETIVLKCLEKEPHRRYPSAQELAEDLGRFLRGEPILARPIGRVGKVAKWGRRNPRLASAVSVALLSLLLGLGGVSLGWRRAETQRQRAEAGEYAADMRLAQVAVADGDRSRALALLNKYRPKGKSEVRNPKSEILPRGGTKSQPNSKSETESAARSTLNAQRSTDLRGWEWRYLWQLCQDDALETLHRFTNGIDAIAASRDGRRIAVLNSGEVTLWNLSQRRQVPGFHVGGGGIRALSLTDELLAISAQDTAGQTWIELRELSEGKVVNRLKPQTDAGFLALSPDGNLLVCTDKEGGVRVLDSRSGQTLTNLNLPPTRTESAPMVTFSPDGSRLAIAADWTGHTLVLNAQNWTLLNLRTPPGALVRTLAFSPTTNLLAGGYYCYDNHSRAITLWDVCSGELRGQLANSASAVSALFFTSNGRELVAVNRDGSIRSWSMADYAELRCLQGSRQWTEAITLLSDDHTLAVTDRRSVRLIDLAASNRPPVHVKLATAFSLARKSELKHEDFEAETLDSRAMCRFTCAFTPDSRSFITSDPEGALALWSTWPFALKEKLTALGSNHWGVALSPDGHWLATGHAPPGKVTIWDWPVCSVVTNLDIRFDFFGILHFCRSGNFLVSSVFDNRARINTRLWRSGDWTETPVSRSRLSGAFAVDVSPDERLLAVGYEGNEDNVKLSRFASGEPYAVFSHPGRVAAVQFSPDGRLLVSVAAWGSARLWDVAGRRWLADLEGGTEGLWSAGFSPDGRRIFTGGSESTDSVRIWDPVSHRELLSLSTGGLWFWLTAFSPDGNTLAAAALSGTTYLWHAPSWEEIEAVEDRQKTP